MLAELVEGSVEKRPGGGTAGGQKKIAVLGGSSATGMYAVHLAKQRGWTVLASCSGRNGEFVKGMGADEVVDYTRESVRERVAAFKPDAILDCVGGTECLGLARMYVTIVGDKTSRVAMGGRNTYLWNPQMLLRALLGKVGMGKGYTCVNLIFRKEYVVTVLGLEKEKVVIDSVFDFEHVKEAFEKLIEGRTRGKVVVRIQ